MKFAIWIIFIGLLIAFASAGVIPQEDYLPPALEEEQVVAEQPIEETAALADDGYRYKTVRKLRHRRDVSELLASGAESAVLAEDGYHYRAPEPAALLEKVTNDYLPPNEEASEIKEASEAPEVTNEYLPPSEEIAENKEAPVSTEAPAISEAPVIADIPEILGVPEVVEAAEVPEVPQVPQVPEVPEVPEVQEVPEVPKVPEVPEVPEVPTIPEAAEVTNEYLPPADDSVIIEGPPESAAFADDGYHYRRVRYRRDVSEIFPPSSGYLYEAPAATENVASDYLPPAEVKEATAEPSEEPEVVNEYLPPVAQVKEAPEVVEAPIETAQLADDGYRYKTIRRLKYRHRRDVSEIVAHPNGYLYEAPAATENVASDYLPPAEVKEATAEPSEEPEVVNEYLPPVAQVKEAPEVVEAPIETAQLADDGYRYKTIRRLKYRHRRDVSEIVAPSNGYLYEAPAATENVASDYLPPAEVKEATAEPSEEQEVVNEYLPPVAEVKEVPEVVEAPIETAQLANDGYRYKTIRRLKYRHRRDVSEIVAPSNGYLYEAPAATENVASDYLPPAEVKEATAEPSEEPEVVNEYLPPVAEVKEAPEVVEAPIETAQLANDGYRYKTIRRLKYRHRRDVSEIVAPASGYLYEAPVATEEVADVYLPPAEVKEAIAEPSEEPEVVNEYLPPVAEVKEAPQVVEAPAETAQLADDGYRYKIIRRLKYRHRRDVSELVTPIAESAILAEDGYHYRTPEASELIPQVSNEYLPPDEEVAEVKEAPEVNEAPVESEVIISTAAPAVTETIPLDREAAPVVIESAPVVTEASPLVTEEPTITETPKVSNEYLPPSDEVAELKEASETPEETAVLADDGYHYKVGKRFKFRRDVSEITAPSSGYLYEAPAATEEVANVYLPPAEIKESAAEPTDVPQVSNEYIPPAEETKDDAEIVEAPQESAARADDGYRYKTVRRLKYRIRRDVSEIAAPQNAPNGYFYPSPVREAIEVPAEVPVEVPVEESAVLANDGYRYKTVRRIRYRFRRDVSELVAPAEESAVLAEDGYHYKKPENELPTPNVANDYLPPTKEVADTNEAPAAPEASDAEVVEAAPEIDIPVVADTISNEYLPPVEEARIAPEDIESPQESAPLTDDGYSYKTVRRICYRHRRDVSEIVNTASNGYVYEAPAANEPIASEPVANEYLPPVEEATELKEAAVEPTEAAPEISNEYLPPGEETRGNAEIIQLPQQSATLADDGYRYKTVRRIRYRHRRDVSEIVAPQEQGYSYNAPVEAEPEVEYLPPTEDVAEVKEANEIPETPVAALAEDGYRYKTVKRLRYKHRV